MASLMDYRMFCRSPLLRRKGIPSNTACMLGVLFALSPPDHRVVVMTHYILKSRR